jgi:hypothetical protein
MQFFSYSGFRVSSIILLIVLIYIGISLYNAKKKYGVPPDPEHLPRRMDVQFQRMCRRRPERGGYNHVGNTTATSNLIKKQRRWGVLCPNQPTGVEDRQNRNL